MVYDASLGYDDAMPDAFQEWIQKIDCDEWLDLMDKFRQESLMSPLKVWTAEQWLWEYFAEDVYPELYNKTYEE